jgi:hypothetical protein
MWIRGLACAAVIGACFWSTACEKLPPQDQERPATDLDASKLTTTIPLEYGDLIGATTNSVSSRWVTLYFQKPDKTIVVVGLDQKTWKVWKEPQVYKRN